MNPEMAKDMGLRLWEANRTDMALKGEEQMATGKNVQKQRQTGRHFWGLKATTLDGPGASEAP